MTKERIQSKGRTVRIYAQSGWSNHVNGKMLCKLRNTGNGYIAKFPSFSSAADDNYVTLDYSEAELLYKALKHFDKELSQVD